MRQLTALALLITTFQLYAQENYQITGYVVDQETGQPVPYASVGVPEQRRGISANFNGYFLLILPDKNPDHHLQISSIGYQPKSIPLSEVEWGVEQTIVLKPEPQLLDEVVIRGKRTTLEGLLKSASKNRKVFLRSTPYLMNGFYREVLTIDQEYRGLTEAQGILYLNGFDRSYKNNSQQMTYDLVQWKHIRRSNYPETHQYLEISDLLKAKDYYLHHGPLRKKNLNRLSYSVTDSTSYQDRLVLEISFEAKPEYQQDFAYRGKMYVKEDDQALLGLEIEAQGAEPFLRQSESQSEFTSEFQISFIQFDGQYYLGNTNLSRSFSEEGHQHSWQLQLFGASFVDQKATFLNYNQRVVLYSEMLNPVVNYHPEFWERFSFAESDFLQEVAAGKDLTSQFESHHQHRLVPLPEGFESYQQMSNDRDALEMILQR